MGRYLEEYQVDLATRRGCMVGQFLGISECEGKTIFKYLMLIYDGTYEMWCETKVQHWRGYLSVSEYPDLNPGERHIHYFRFLEDALSYAVDQYGAQPDRWVEAFDVTKDYECALDPSSEVD